MDVKNIPDGLICKGIFQIKSEWVYSQEGRGLFSADYPNPKELVKMGFYEMWFGKKSNNIRFMDYRSVPRRVIYRLLTTGNMSLDAMSNVFSQDYVHVTIIKANGELFCEILPTWDAVGKPDYVLMLHSNGNSEDYPHENSGIVFQTTGEATKDGLFVHFVVSDNVGE